MNNGHIVGYRRIRNRLSSLGFDLDAFQVDYPRSESDYSWHCALDFQGEKQFAIIAYESQIRNRKHRNRVRQTLLEMSGKRFRHWLAKKLTACGCGVVKPQNIYVKEI